MTDLVPLDLGAEATAIREAVASGVIALLDAGRRLLAVQAALDRGEWTAWLRDQVGLEPRRAQEMMAATARFGSADYAALRRLSPSAVLLLARPSTPPEVVEVALDAAARGEQVTVRELRARARDLATPSLPPPRASRPAAPTPAPEIPEPVVLDEAQWIEVPEVEDMPEVAPTPVHCPGCQRLRLELEDCQHEADRLRAELEQRRHEADRLREELREAQAVPAPRGKARTSLDVAQTTIERLREQLVEQRRGLRVAEMRWQILASQPDLEAVAAEIDTRLQRLGLTTSTTSSSTE